MAYYPICFPANTPICTDQGRIPICKINPKIHTILQQPIKMVTKTKTYDKYLVCFKKDSLKPNTPNQDTYISKNHAVYNNGKWKHAFKYVNDDNIVKTKYNGETLYNILMDTHSMIMVNNIVCETLHPNNAVVQLNKFIENLPIEKQEQVIKQFNHAVQEVSSIKEGVSLTVTNKKDEIINVEGDYCLVAVGRKPYTEGLGLENTNIETDKAGRIVTNEHLQTASNHIYAIGDVVKGAMLAHKAEEEGVYVAEFIANQKPHLDHNLIPGVVYTWPEVAAVGKTEDELKEIGIDYKVGQFPIRALGRARASMDIQGLIKIISDKETDEVLGVHMIAPRAADLIMEAVVAMEYRASAEDIARICHPHPTYSEAVKEAALAATESRPLHI